MDPSSRADAYEVVDVVLVVLNFDKWTSLCPTCCSSFAEVRSEPGVLWFECVCLCGRGGVGGSWVSVGVCLRACMCVSGICVVSVVSASVIVSPFLISLDPCLNAVVVFARQGKSLLGPQQDFSGCAKRHYKINTSILRLG